MAVPPRMFDLVPADKKAEIRAFVESGGSRREAARHFRQSEHVVKQICAGLPVAFPTAPDVRLTASEEQWLYKEVVAGRYSQAAQERRYGLPKRQVVAIMRRGRAGFSKPIPTEKESRMAMAAMRRNGASFESIAAEFGISVTSVRRYISSVCSDERRAAPKVVGMPVTRVVLATGGVLTVSHGEGAEYAEALATALCEGLEVASREVVGA